MLKSLMALPLFLGIVSLTLADDAAGPVRIASGVSGHIHPAVCVSKKGTVIVVFSQSNFKDLRLTRSRDGGLTWSKPVPFPHAEKLSIYPGSLTTLADGRIVHMWNTWFMDEKKGKSRFQQYSVSKDDGVTWSKPASVPKNPEGPSVIRHPFLELGPKRWLLSLSDRTVVFEPDTGKLTPWADGQKHGLVPIVRTPKGTLVSGKGLRSTDEGKSWQTIKPFPKIGGDGWRYDMTALASGLLVASEVQGPGHGGTSWRFIVSRDDGKSWDFDHPYEFYNPGRAIGGRACPRSVLVDKDTLGTVFYDDDKKQPGGAGVFFLRAPLKSLSTNK